MAEDAFGIVGSVIASAYRVESVMAEGGFGTVYRAHHGGFRAPVALKCLRLPPGLLPEARQHFLEAFRAEAELLFRLSASIPNVVRPLHADAFTLPEPDGRFVPYIVLEWLDGHTLDALIRKRRAEGQAPFALKKLVRWLTPVARALERAHNFQGPDGPVSIVHRDLKPENIFVADVAGEEVVKILDFGIGKAKSMVSQAVGRASQGTPSSIATFTPAYGSPEQWAPRRFGQTGPWTDVWGLALTLSEGLVGHPLFDGDPAAIMAAVLDPSRRPTPGSEGAIVSDEVERVMAKALALDPRDRYADAGVFWNELLAAARISSGELAEVRLPRDGRAEAGGGPRVERLEPMRRPSGAPLTSGARRPGPERAPLAAAAPGLRSPSPAPAAFPSSVSGSFEVPDLDVAPISRPPPRSISGKFPAVSQPLDFDDASATLEASVPLDLDLPSHDPLHRRVSSGAMQAVRPPIEPVPSGGHRSAYPARRSSNPPAGSPSPIPLASPPPTISSQPPRFSSSPPVSRAGASNPPPPAPSPGLDLAPKPGKSLLTRLLPGGVIVLCAILVTLLDRVYSQISGEIFTLGGFRTGALAGLMMLLGIGVGLYRWKRG